MPEHQDRQFLPDGARYSVDPGELCRPEVLEQVGAAGAFDVRFHPDRVHIKRGRILQHQEAFPRASEQGRRIRLPLSVSAAGFRVCEPGSTVHAVDSVDSVDSFDSILFLGSIVFTWLSRYVSIQDAW